MKTLKSGLPLSMVLIAVAPAIAADTGKTSQKEVTACPAAIADIATCYTAQDGNGAYLLAAMPKTWNGDLIVYTHGGPSLVPLTPAYSQPNLTASAIEIKLGYAWVASAYRREGYGVRMSATDADMSRRFFVDQIAKPNRTILHGVSYGTLVAVKTLEMYGQNADGTKNYVGALLQSGILAAPSRGGYEFRADLHAVYQYYCKNLPRPDEASFPVWMGLPSDSRLTPADVATLVDECTGVGHPADARTAKQKQNLSAILGVMGIEENFLVFNMQQATLLFRGIIQNITHGGSPFTNIGIVYKGSPDDSALNRDVERFAADPSAVADLRFDGEPTGALSVPVVAIHSNSDPLAAVESESVFRDLVTAGGNATNLVQAYTDEHAHAAQSAPEVAAAINALVQWIDKGTKPTPQSIAAMCDQMRPTYDGRCSYHPEYQPKSFDTRFYARPASTH